MAPGDMITLAILGTAVTDADADADADPGYGYGHGAVSAPVCHSVPEKTCVPRLVETPRKVCHQEYDEIVDTTITEHCEEVVTTTCQQTSQKVHHSSAVAGHAHGRYAHHRCQGKRDVQAEPGYQLGDGRGDAWSLVSIY